MCATCGCDSETQVKILFPNSSESTTDKHAAHEHEPHQHHSHERLIDLEIDVLNRNNLIAERNRGYLEARNIFCVNLVSSPGSGKTTLLEKTIQTLGPENIYIIEGDQQTMNDANRIALTGASVVQVNTGNGCHLDASMIHEALIKLNPAEDSLLIIENVGNLVCPALFDLGEHHRVVIMSVTEGEDKPLKYPGMFTSSQVCIINKTDLLPYLEFDLSRSKEYLRQVNSQLKVFELSATNNENLNEWVHWLQHHLPQPTN